MITKQHSFACVIVSVLLGVWMDVANGMSIQLIPQYPAIRGSVTLSVTGRIQSIAWFKGPIPGTANAILLYIPGLEPNLLKGLSFNDRMTVSPDGSLMISNLNIADEGNYTAKIYTDRLHDIHVYMKIYEPLHDNENYSNVTVSMGPVILIAVAILLVLVTVLAYLFVRNRRHKKQSFSAQNASEAPVYENVNASRSHTNETTLPGIPVQGTQDSHYEQLTHKDRTVYSTLASKDKKY